MKIENPFETIVNIKDAIATQNKAFAIFLSREELYTTPATTNNIRVKDIRKRIIIVLE